MDPEKWEIEWKGGPNDIHPRQKAIYLKEQYPDASQTIQYDIMPEPLGESV